MFRSSNSDKGNITIFVDDKAVRARAGDLIATILLNHGIAAVYPTLDGVARGPYCLMGVCFDCLIRCEDGRIEQACQIYAEDGMKIYLPLTDQSKKDVHE